MAVPHLEGSQLGAQRLCLQLELGHLVPELLEQRGQLAQPLTQRRIGQDDGDGTGEADAGERRHGPRGSRPQLSEALGTPRVPVSARINATNSGPTPSPTAPKAARPPSKAKKMTAPCISAPPLMSRGFTTLSLRPTTTTPHTARKRAQPVCPWKKSTAATTTDTLAAPTAGMKAVKKVSSAQSKAFGIRAMRKPTSAATACTPAVPTLETTTARETWRNSSRKLW